MFSTVSTEFSTGTSKNQRSFPHIFSKKPPRFFFHFSTFYRRKQYGVLQLTFTDICDIVYLREPTHRTSLAKHKEVITMSKICCFTGHRDIKSLSASSTVDRLKRILAYLVERHGVEEFRAGGAVGFDSIAALEVINLKSKYPHVKLHLVLPCKDQARYFKRMQTQVYDFVMDNADEITYISEQYRKGVMFERNRALVRGADFCVSFLIKEKSGTAYTVNEARKAGIPVINIAKPFDFAELRSSGVID